MKVGLGRHLRGSGEPAGNYSAFKVTAISEIGHVNGGEVREQSFELGAMENKQEVHQRNHATAPSSSVNPLPA